MIPILLQFELSLLQTFWPGYRICAQNVPGPGKPDPAMEETLLLNRRDIDKAGDFPWLFPVHAGVF